MTTRGEAARDTFAMITDAGVTVAANSDYDGPTPDTGEFRLPGPLGDLLKPEISARS